MTNPSGNCTKCGAAIKLGARFCEACGTAMAAAPPPPPSPAPSVPPAPPAPAMPAPPMPVAPTPAISAPRRGSAGIVVGVICAVLLLAVLATGVVWISQHRILPPVAGDGRQTADVPKTPPTSQPPAPKLDSNTTYLPAPGLRLTYHELFADGDEGDWELVTAQLNGEVELSSVECLDSYATAGENDVATMHCLSDADGVWKVEDIRPENRELYLPTEVTVGTTFASSGVTGKVVAVGKTCDLGFVKLIDCLVVERNYGEVGYTETQYFAPGHGIVLTKSDNATMRKLTGVTRMDATEATAFVKKHTTWQKALEK